MRANRSLMRNFIPAAMWVISLRVMGTKPQLSAQASLNRVKMRSRSSWKFLRLTVRVVIRRRVLATAIRRTGVASTSESIR